jgi:SAM-dependent methyltransferase
MQFRHTSRHSLAARFCWTVEALSIPYSAPYLVCCPLAIHYEAIYQGVVLLRIPGLLVSTMATSSLEPKCPVCSSIRLITLHKFSSEEAAQHFVRREGDSDRHHDLVAHIEELWGGGWCAVRHCEYCEFSFSDPYVAGDMRFYNLAYESVGYPMEKWEYTRTVGDLASAKFHADRVLEVGSGYGFFLDKIADVYVAKSGITALEFDDRAVCTLRNKGYATSQNDIRTTEVEAGVDAVFMFQVLEHMDNLDSLFDQVSSLLCDGGLLFVAVPNPKRISFNEQNGSLVDMPPNHIGRWSEPAFKTIGQRHGFRLDQYEVEPFSLKKFVMQDINCSYLRRSQIKGTVANWSRSIRSERYGLLRRAVAAMYAPRRLNVWRRAAKAGDLGGSAWAKFSKSAI